MIYVMSDIHGHYSRYRSVMKQIRLRKTDHLYVLGDCIDRNPFGLPILKELYPKAVGLAKFASKHWDKFGRIQLIRKMIGLDGNEHFYRLDMSDLQVCQRVLSITSNQELDHIFADAATRDE